MTLRESSYSSTSKAKGLCLVTSWQFTFSPCTPLTRISNKNEEHFKGANWCTSPFANIFIRTAYKSFIKKRKYRTGSSSPFAVDVIIIIIFFAVIGLYLTIRFVEDQNFSVVFVSKTYYYYCQALAEKKNINLRGSKQLVDYVNDFFQVIYVYLLNTLVWNPLVDIWLPQFLSSKEHFSWYCEVSFNEVCR